MTEQERITRRMVEAMGHATQSFGVGRVIGQIFAHLYFSRQPQSLDDLTHALGISKGSASMGVRQLEQWGAVEKVWIKGRRKDYYQANDTFGRILKSALADLAGKRIEISAAVFEAAEADIRKAEASGTLTREEQFIQHRIEKIRSFQRKAQDLWNSALLQMLLKH